jgi:hypothetical protein
LRDRKKKKKQVSLRWKDKRPSIKTVT